MTETSAAVQIATLIHDGFDVFYSEFKRLTRECRQWFDNREWIRMHEESHARIDLYQRHVRRVLDVLERDFGELPRDVTLWAGAHRHFAVITEDRVDREVAETFFNAITRKTFKTEGVNAQIEFLENHFYDAGTELRGLYRRIPSTDDLGAVFRQILSIPRPALGWVDRDQEAAYLAQRLEAHLRKTYGTAEFDFVDVLQVLFFRVREAYIVGRIARGGRITPLIIPLQPVASGVVVDGAIFSVEETLAVFSSTRAYMFVDVHKPGDLVRFLGTLMPELTLSELYVAIAHHRHGKTLIYRELVEHLDRSDDKFIIAPGIRGLVMTVFTMPNYRNVFKIIRDTFEKPSATRPAIMQSYRDVFRGRRVGRLADTQEFEHLAFDRSRFTESCLSELLAKASNTVRVVGDKVIVKHCYIEEKLKPLNLYLAEAPAPQAEAAMVDYGDAIKELAANNIFAGDLLWKNFGVSAFGRAVLYDYDEICPLLACNFRDVPEPKTYEQEMAATPWYPIAEEDVFPAEWEPFIVPKAANLAQAFRSAHTDLMTAQMWRQKQRDVLEGELSIGLPYAPRYPELHDPPGDGTG
ncbi:MAG: bifunctional isocitrate dehydrogenase kinase/phosphatase [Myxococcota bacterium]